MVKRAHLLDLRGLFFKTGSEIFLLLRQPRFQLFDFF
jgi:hypothetical protein